eukprot:455179-Pelagomonas_calceolata.AAC.4
MSAGSNTGCYTSQYYKLALSLSVFASIVQYHNPLRRTFLDTNAGADSGSSAKRRAMSEKDSLEARDSSSSMPKIATAT